MKKHYLNLGAKRIAYYNEGQGIPLIFLHGFGTSSEFWTQIIQNIDLNKYQCLIPDLPGFGDTLTPMDNKYGLDYYVDLLLLFYTKVVGKNIKPVLIGHGFGTSLILAWAIHHPGMYSKLVLANPIFYINKPPQYLKKYILAAKNEYIWNAYVKSGLFFFNLKQTFKNGCSPINSFPLFKIESFLRTFKFSFSSHTRLRKVLLDLNFEIISNLSGFIRKIKKPTLILTGKHDPYIKREYFSQLKADLPYAKSIIIPNAGFYTPIETPERFALELCKFLNL